MQETFRNIDKQNQLKIILDEWIGTPFRHYCGVKNIGCDCMHFIIRVFEEMNLLTLNKNNIPYYSKDWFLHDTKELLQNEILKRPDVKEVCFNDRLNGDVILFYFGKALSHAGIYFDNYVYQSIYDMGVCKINVEDKKFKKRIRFLYRYLQ